jgi:hypothetical protein
VWASNCGLVKTPQRFKGVDAILYMLEGMKEISKRACFLDCHKVVVEFPAVFYNPKFSGGAITPVAGVSGACMILFQHDDTTKVLPVYPTVWNGGKKKKTTAKLIEQIIGAPEEWQYDDNPTKTADFEHIIDAVGMAYWLMQRDYFERDGGE